MKCECEECEGTGRIECPECDGHGSCDRGIDCKKLDRNADNYEELLELQKDAKRVIRQAKQLKEMNPARTDSYQAQLEATLEVINKEADETAKRK